jgi:DUF1016 N-terminal domain
MTLATTTEYQNLLSQIAETYSQNRIRAMQMVNSQMTTTYWQVGQHIVEFEQGGKVKAEYGKALISNLARDLSVRLGKGFGRTNLVYMRLFYLRYPISQKPSDLLSWSHYIELLKLDDALERGFYEQQAIAERWSVPELKRQKDSALFLRLASSKDKAKILELSTRGQILEQAEDILREPYIFEFLKIHEPDATLQSFTRIFTRVRQRFYIRWQTIPNQLKQCALQS